MVLVENLETTGSYNSMNYMNKSLSFVVSFGALISMIFIMEFSSASQSSLQIKELNLVNSAASEVEVKALNLVDNRSSSVQVVNLAPTSVSVDNEVMQLSAQAKNLNPKVIKLALIAYHNAVKQGVTQKKYLTIVDYSLPSTERRLWVFDLENNKMLFNELVAHGKCSGENQSTSFSNDPSSNKSSIGLFVTGDTYSGKHGYSLRLNGMEQGFNSNAKERAVVMHSANYVNDNIAKTGRLGRSLGCLALDPAVSKSVIDVIKDGTVIFSYYPNPIWLAQSHYLVA